MMRYLARGPMYEADVITEDPWTGNPNRTPNLTRHPTSYPNPNPNPCVEVRWVVDGFNMNRKRHFRPGWGKTTPYPYPNPVQVTSPKPINRPVVFCPRVSGRRIHDTMEG